ncbi:hypothetical protein ACVSQB_41745 [Bradyrhizobium elkanii]
MGKGMVLTPCAINPREPLRDALRRLDDVVRTLPVRAEEFAAALYDCRRCRPSQNLAS